VPESPPAATRDGGPRICFVRDPDGHRIELVDAPRAAQSNGR
jgi:lactoylglutathione lyase